MSTKIHHAIKARQYRELYRALSPKKIKFCGFSNPGTSSQAEPGQPGLDLTWLPATQVTAYTLTPTGVAITTWQPRNGQPATL